MNPVASLTVVYDERCAFCRRCRRWLSEQPTHVPLAFLAAGAPEARQRYGTSGWLAAELAVIDETGRAWIGADAFLMALWATRPYRALALTLRNPVLRPLARTFFEQVSLRRHRPEPAPPRPTTPWGPPYPPSGAGPTTDRGPTPATDTLVWYGPGPGTGTSGEGPHCPGGGCER